MDSIHADNITMVEASQETKRKPKFIVAVPPKRIELKQQLYKTKQLYPFYSQVLFVGHGFVSLEIDSRNRDKAASIGLSSHPATWGVPCMGYPYIYIYIYNAYETN